MMQAVVMPCCPYCSARYMRIKGDRLEKSSPTIRILVTCPRCKERYYVGKQIRYVSRREPV